MGMSGGGPEPVDYTDTFIAIAPDASGEVSVPGPRGGKPTVVSATFDMISEAPYRHTSGDVIFTVWADRQGISESEREAARTEFYSVGRACLRASDLGKRFGWGIHADGAGRLALYGAGTPEYESLDAGVAPDGSTVAVVRAMRSSRR